jgi:hypothetical protein
MIVVAQVLRLLLSTAAVCRTRGLLMPPPNDRARHTAPGRFPSNQATTPVAYLTNHGFCCNSIALETRCGFRPSYSYTVHTVRISPCSATSEDLPGLASHCITIACIETNKRALLLIERPQLQSVSNHIVICGCGNFVSAALWVHYEPLHQIRKPSRLCGRFGLGCGAYPTDSQLAWSRKHILRRVKLLSRTA